MPWQLMVPSGVVRPERLCEDSNRRMAHGVEGVQNILPLLHIAALVGALYFTGVAYDSHGVRSRRRTFRSHVIS